MLISFSLKNYRSFLDRQTFSLTTPADRLDDITNGTGPRVINERRLSKAALLIGPNASGKSNFLHAVMTFKRLVVHSSSMTDGAFSALHMPFQFGPSIEEPTEFDIEILLRGIRYHYAVAYDAERVRSESLYVTDVGRSQRWFSRRYDDASRTEQWQPFSPNVKGSRKLWQSATRQRALFLNVASRLNSSSLLPLFHWFENRVDICLPAGCPQPADVAARVQSPAKKQEILEVFRRTGMRVTDVRLTEGFLRAQEADVVRLKDSVSFNSAGPAPVEFQHTHAGSPPRWLSTSMEASGTYRLFALIGLLLDAVEHEKLLLLDQFDANLHPLVARFLVGRFIDSSDVTNHAQLIVTSYNTTLMDLDMVRRDEIWMMSLDEQGASSMKRVSSTHASRNPRNPILGADHPGATPRSAEPPHVC